MISLCEGVVFTLLVTFAESLDLLHTLTSRLSFKPLIEKLLMICESLPDLDFLETFGSIFSFHHDVVFAGTVFYQSSFAPLSVLLFLLVLIVFMLKMR